MALQSGLNSTDYTKTTLYTKGGEYTLESTGQEYRGEYHLANGVPFTGKPKNKLAKRLLPFVYDKYSTYVYDRAFQFKNKAKTQKPPKFFRPQPSQSDYKTGYIYRYVVTHNINKEKFPIEIAVTQANSFGAPTGVDAGLWALHKVKWQIAGAIENYETKGGVVLGIENANRAAVAVLLPKYPMMQFAFRNYTEFAQPTFF
jgi:hypothetical protein